MDACGICQGDGSNCQKIKIEFTEENLPRGHNKIGTIPRGACNITLTEQRPSGNVFGKVTQAPPFFPFPPPYEYHSEFPGTCHSYSYMKCSCEI